MTARRVLVTGGGSGIGAATCEALERDGITAIPADLRPPDGGLRLDVRDEDSWAAAMSQIGSIDGLVACAGVLGNRAPVHESSISDFDQVLAVNLRGTYLGVRAVSRHWIDAGQPGAIVAAASVNGYMAAPGQAHYATSKAAVIHFTKAAALDLAPHQIRMNAIAPGPVLTPMTAVRMQEPGRDEWAKNVIPLGRIAQTDDITPAILFLLSDASRYITGTTVLLDGGMFGTAKSLPSRSDDVAPN